MISRLLDRYQANFTRIKSELSTLLQQANEQFEELDTEFKQSQRDQQSFKQKLSSSNIFVPKSLKLDDSVTHSLTSIQTNEETIDTKLDNVSKLLISLTLQVQNLSALLNQFNNDLSYLYQQNKYQHELLQNMEMVSALLKDMQKTGQETNKQLNQMKQYLQLVIHEESPVWSILQQLYNSSKYSLWTPKHLWASREPEFIKATIHSTIKHIAPVSQIQQHYVWLTNNSNKEHCTTNKFDGVRHNFANLTNEFSLYNNNQLDVVNATSSHATQVIFKSCLWQYVLKELSSGSTVTQLPHLLLLNKRNVPSKWLQPASLLSFKTVEGITWKIGFNGVPDQGVLKYAKTNNPEGATSMMHELLIGQVLNTLVHLTPNFTYVYSGFICQPPIADKFADGFCQSSLSAHTRVCIIMEPVNDSVPFSDFIMIENLSQLDVVNAAMQLLCTFAIAYVSYKYLHNDLHLRNVLVYKVQIPVTIRYQFGHQTLSLTNVQYIMKVIDYGTSSVYVDGKWYLPIKHNVDKSDSEYELEDMKYKISNDGAFIDLLRKLFYDASDASLWQRAPPEILLDKIVQKIKTYKHTFQTFEQAYDVLSKCYSEISAYTL